jgi:hypothetical protein
MNTFTRILISTTLLVCTICLWIYTGFVISKSNSIRHDNHDTYISNMLNDSNVKWDTENKKELQLQDLDAVDEVIHITLIN